MTALRRRPASPSPRTKDPTPRRPGLLHYSELPPWRQDNAFLLTAYRPESRSYAGSLLSTFALHNETVNIWTHLAAAAGFAGVVAVLLFSSNALLAQDSVLAHYRRTATPPDRLVFACFFAGAVGCLGMSATYHALTNHSPPVARWSNKLDYTGIVLLTVGSYVPALYYGLWCRPTLMTVYLYMTLLLGLGCALVSWVEHFRTPAWRPYRALIFVVFGSSGLLPTLHGIRLYGYRGLNERMSTNFILLEGFCYLFGAVIYAARWPERVYPKTFDVVGSSHQIFHVFVVLAALAHFYGMLRAFDFHHGPLGQVCY